jgi:hypothetical protein
MQFTPSMQQEYPHNLDDDENKEQSTINEETEEENQTKLKNS